MKVTALIFSLFLSLTIFANEDNKLTVQQDGMTIEVLNFEDGDKLKLFELESGDHILSKSYSFIDLSQLPIGSYVLENNEGKSVIIDRQEEELIIDGAVVSIEEDFVVEADSELVAEEDVNVEEEFINTYVNKNDNLLAIERNGDVIEVIDFEDGDKLKLFEVKDTVHVLSKTTNVIDLSQLPVGLYVLENSKGASVIVEKFIESQNTLTDL
ncbi:hypothetical protein [uncultured Aquimarina sp.]|uniref:hypothetical protein n=1 Tax=uncultured Aquimarina sp. TaxID=575652 RepID=UPI0026260B8F|nr:hypothetical protein [uncultured Aquimarina sp.]